MGGWGIFEPQEFFFRYQIPFMNFLGHSMNIFFRVNWCALLFFFFFIYFSLARNFFFCTSPTPAPDKFSNGPSLNSNSPGKSSTVHTSI